MTKTLENFYNDLGARESGGKYTIINKWGYVGKYQMGEAAMVDAGYYKKSSGNYNNDWKGEFTGKDGVYSLDDFLYNKQAQENAQKAFKLSQWRQLKAIGADKYLGREINGIKVTQSGLLAAAHLKGPGSVQQYLNSNGRIVPKDALGTSVETYIKKFSGYDVSEITGLKSDTETQTKNTPITLKVGIEKNVDRYGNHIFTPEEIGNLSREDFEKYLPIIEQQLKDGLIKPPSQQEKDYSGYINPATGSRKLYSREDIASMTTDEYLQNEHEIMAQMQSIGIPTNNELYSASSRGGTIYVRPYTRSDGTPVRGYYRSV